MDRPSESPLGDFGTEAVLHAAPVPVVALDTEGRVRFWNPAAERTFGWSAEEVLGEPHPLVPEKEESRFRTLLAGARSGEKVEGEVVRRHHKDGSELEIALWTEPVRDDAGRIRGVIGVLHDITDRRRLEEELRRSRARFRALFDEAADAMFLHHPGGKIVDVNREACESLGYAREELLEMTIPDIVVESGPKERTRELKTLKPGERLGGLRGVHERKDGTRFPVEVEIAVIDWEGEPLSLAVARDVTERRRMEEELRHAQKMQAVGELAGGVAHDFNNRLTAILGLTSMMLADLEEDHPFVEDLHEVHTAAKQAAALTEQLLAYSRRQIQRPVVFEVNAVVEELEDMLRGVLPETIRLVFELDPGTGYVEADPGQMHEVLLALVVNARDAMPDGGTLTIRTLPGPAEEAPAPVTGGGPWVRLEVEDTGCGIRPEIQDRIFEPFFTTRPAGERTGLGLSTVYGIVEQTGGYVTVESAPGEGSTFLVFLPRAEPPEKKTERPGGPVS